VPSTADLSLPPLPEDVGQYAGKWVALRGDEVIASADSLAELRENEQVTRDDAVYVVPEPDKVFL
jgi:Family of unknown function (DUF5678)